MNLQSQEPQILRSGPVLCLLCATVMLGVALNPSMIVAVLKGLAVEPDAARLAGAQLSVLIGMTGGGGLLIGITLLARATRLRQGWAEHAAHLERVAHPMGGRVQQVPGVGVGFVAEIHGLRLEVVLEPEQNGAIWVRAHCPAQAPLTVWPLGMAPKTPSEGWLKVADGRSWEGWAPVMIPGAEPMFGDALRGALDALFGEGGAARMRHDSGGIEVELPRAMDSDFERRIQSAVDAVVAMARYNH